MPKAASMYKLKPFLKEPLFLLKRSDVYSRLKQSLIQYSISFSLECFFEINNQIKVKQSAACLGDPGL